MSRRVGSPEPLFDALWLLGIVACETGETGLAVAVVSEAFELAGDPPDYQKVVDNLSMVALVAAALSWHEAAARFLGAAERERELVGMPPLLPERRAYERWASESLAVLGDHAYEEARQQGRHLALHQSLREARDFLASRTDDARRPPSTATSHTNGLSPRELDVLRLVADGRSDREIAEELFIGPGTVRTHLAHAFGKLEVGSRTAAIAAARRRGIL